MARALEDDGEWSSVMAADWFKTGQALAGEHNFFHWKLEFPEVFYEEDGTKRGSGGFDAVASNPPYIKTQTLRSKLPKLTDYLIASSEYTTAEGRFDIYAPFIEKGIKIAANGRISYILPNKFFTRKHGEPLRRYLTQHQLPREILDFGKDQVFDDVTTYTCILSLHIGSESFDYKKSTDSIDTVGELRDLPSVNVSLNDIGTDPWVLTGPKQMQVLRRMDELGNTMDDVTDEIAEGITSGDNDILFVRVLSEDGDTTIIESPADGQSYTVESELIRPLTDGNDINRFQPLDTDMGVIYPYTLSDDETRLIPEEQLKDNFPKTYSYLSKFRERLANRGTARTNKEYKTWYSHYRARDMSVFEQPKLLTPDICGQSEFSMDDDGGRYFKNSAFGFVPKKIQKVFENSIYLY
jgi:hypothetical protein